MSTEHTQPSRKWSALGSDNLRCTDRVESEGVGQLCAGRRPFAPGEAGAEKTQLSEKWSGPGTEEGSWETY